MATSDGYEQRLGERLRLENAPAIVTQALRKADMAVTEIRCDDPSPGMSGSIPREGAFLVGLLLRDFPNREYWEDGRQAAVCNLRAGETCLYDLKRNPTVLLDKPYHCLLFYLPRAALNALADDANAPQIGELNYKPGPGIDDATISSLGSTMRPHWAVPSKPTGCLSTTSCWRSGSMSLRPMGACGRQRGRAAVGSRRGRSDAPRKFFAPTSTAVRRSKTLRGSAACQ
jgi:AraC family transcriptional regulator